MSGDVNGAELALRIAYFDVVGKWRRSQEKCKYLEESRNLLVKELIRIKQVNEDLLKENSALTASLETSASLPNRTDVAATTSGCLRQAKSHSPLVPGSSPADRHRQDEQDLEQITQRLLTELQKEIARTRAKSSPPQPLVAGCSDKNLLIDEDASGVAANNSVGSELLVGNQPITSSASQRSDHVQWNKNQGREQQQAAVNGGSDVRSAGGAGLADHTDDKRQSVGPETKVAADPSAGPAADVRNEDSLSHVYAKIIASLTADLNKATGRIVSQNEKLTKLKSRQLRSYFRRQLKGEADQMSGNIPNPGSRCHTEHV